MATKKKDTNAELLAALTDLEAALPHIAHLGASGQRQAIDLATRAKRLLSPEDPVALVAEMNAFVDELTRVVEQQRQRIIETENERRRQQETQSAVRAELLRQKEDRRLERLRAGAVGGS